MNTIHDDVLNILKECRVEGETLFLPNRQLDRPIYQAVNKVLVNLGGKWDRKAKGHVFTDGDPVELLNAVLMTGEVADLKKEYQFFPTPRPVAEQMCKLAELDKDSVVLEPSCGKGDLANVIYKAGVKFLYGVELNPEFHRYLKDKPYRVVTGVDFLDFAKDPFMHYLFNRIVMNPPFTRQQDIDHILAAYDLLPPGGILVSVVSESPFFVETKKAIAFREFLSGHDVEVIQLDEGAFKESRTMVRTRIVKLKKGGDHNEK